MNIPKALTDGLLRAALCLAASLPLPAQTLHLSGCIEGEPPSGMSLFAAPADEPEGTPLELSAEGCFRGELPVAPDGFYKLFGRDGESHFIIPFYVPAGEQEARGTLCLSAGRCGFGVNDGSRALGAFLDVCRRRSETLWERGGELSTEELLALLRGYREEADSLVASCGCPDSVAEYLRLWAFTSAADGYANLSHLLRRQGRTVPFSEAGVTGEAPERVLDTPLSLHFSSAGLTSLRALPKGSLRQRLTALYGRYRCEAVRERVAGLLLSRHIASFDYSGDFEGGLAELEALVGDFGLSPAHVEAFRARRASAVGSEFPDTLRLEDAAGREADFRRYRGRYVVVDLWASWCVPCCREVPHLQRLEQALRERDIAFVSISLDKSREAWQKRMKELGMEGEQLLDTEGRVAESLNVSGIPRLMLYDREGRLLRSSLPRPSAGPELEELLRSLP